MCDKFRATVMFAFLPCNDREEEMKDTFWEKKKIERAVDYVTPGKKLCVIDDNGWIRDRVGMMGRYGVSGENVYGV